MFLKSLYVYIICTFWPAKTFTYQNDLSLKHFQEVIYSSVFRWEDQNQTKQLLLMQREEEVVRKEL